MAKVREVGLPITLAAPGLNLVVTVAPNLVLGALVRGHVWSPPIIQQLLGGLLVVGMSLDYES